jgi:hypothetical protein
LVREVDVQPSHPGSSLNRREFGFLFFKKQNHCRGFLYRISFQKKIRVVMFCTLPLVAPSQKSTCFDPSGHLKNGKCIFYVETEKILVAKVVGNAKMHISTKNGTMVPQFAVELAQTMVTWQGRPRELLPGSTSL